MTATMETALVTVRLVHFAASFALFGSPAFAMALAARFPATSAVQQDFDRWLRRSLLLAAVVALVSAALWLDVEAAIMGNGWAGAMVPDTITRVLFGTSFGGAWCWHMGIGVALLGGILRLPAGSGMTALVALLAAGFVACIAWAGHAVMHPGFSHLAVQVIHLLAGALWLGSLPALFHLLARARRERSAEWENAVRHMLPLYSRAGYVAVGLVLVTGILNSAFLVDSVGKFAKTPYGQVLVAKIALVLVMVGVAALNRFVLQPRITARRPSAESRIALHRLCRSVALELGTGALVLAAVSVLGTLAPDMTP